MSLEAITESCVGGEIVRSVQEIVGPLHVVDYSSPDEFLYVMPDRDKPGADVYRLPSTVYGERCPRSVEDRHLSPTNLEGRASPESSFETPILVTPSEPGRFIVRWTVKNPTS